MATVALVAGHGVVKPVLIVVDIVELTLSPPFASLKPLRNSIWARLVKVTEAGPHVAGGVVITTLNVIVYDEFAGNQPVSFAFEEPLAL